MYNRPVPYPVYHDTDKSNLHVAFVSRSLYKNQEFRFLPSRTIVTQTQTNCWSYNETADDVVLLIGFAKVLGHAVHRLLGLARVGVGMLLLACTEKQE